MDKNIFKNHIRKLWEQGVQAIPVEGKRPVVNQWSKYSGEAASSMVIESWETQFPEKNIGCVTGIESGIIAIDYDGLDLDNEVANAIPNSPIERFGKKGFVRFFKYNGEKNKKFRNIKVEIFSNGGQVVLPPSIHPETGQAYKWTGYRSLYDLGAKEELHTIPGDLIAHLTDLDNKYKAASKEKIADGKQSRNNALFAYCSKLVGDGKQRDEVKELLIKYDSENHFSPWFSDKSEPHKGNRITAVNDMISRVLKLEEQNTGHNNWAQPKYFRNEVTKLTKLSSEHLPSLAFDYCQLLSKATGAPIEFLAISLISVFSSLVSRCYVVLPKKKDRSWKVTPNLFSFLIGRPGLKKTPAMKLAAINFLDEIDRNYRAIDKLNIAKAEAERKIIESKIDKIKERYKSGRQQDNDDETIERLEQELAKIEPKLHSILINKITPAELIKVASRTNKTLFIHRDEMSSIFEEMKKNESYQLREILLQGWNGDDSFRKQTKTMGDDEVQKLSLSFLGAIQPSKLDPIISEIKKGQNNDGLLQRFQLVAFPNQYVELPQDINTEIGKKKEIINLLSILQQLDLSSSQSIEVSFDESAQEAFLNFHKKCVERLNSPDTTDLMKEYLSKFDSLVPSVSIIFEVMNTTNNLSELSVISEKSVNMALKFLELNETHLKKMMNYFRFSQQTKTIAMIRKIKEGRITDGMTLREINRSNWSHLNDTTDIRAAAEELESLGWVKVKKLPTKGRPTDQIFVNPTILMEGVDKYIEEGLLK